MLKKETSDWLNSNCTNKTHKKVQLKKCKDNGYDFFKYFIKDTKNIKHREHELVGFYEKSMEENDEPTIIQTKIANELYKNGISPKSIKEIQLYIDKTNYDDNYKNDPGYSESHSLNGKSYLIVHSKAFDFIFLIQSDFYYMYPGDPNYEKAELIKKV